MMNVINRPVAALRNITILNTHILYYFIQILLALAVAAYIGFDSLRPSHYNWLPLLPLSFVIGGVIGHHAYKFFLKKLTVTIIISTYFIRMVIIPLFLSMGHYVGRLSYNKYFPEVLDFSLVYSNMTKAICLMSVEVIVVFIALSLLDLKKGGFFSDFHTNITIESVKVSQLFKVVITALFGGACFILFMYPQMGSYVQFFVVDSVEADIENYLAAIHMKESVPAVLYWLYIMMVNLIQIFVPILLISWIYRVTGWRFRRYGLMVVFMIIGLLFVFMTPEKATSLQLALVLMLIVCMMYPDIMRMRVPIMVTSIGVLTFIVLMLKSGSYKEQGQDGAVFLSYILNAYFGGPLNVAVAISIPTDFTIKTLVADIFRSIPFVKYFFKEWPFTPEIFNKFILGDAPAMKIMPLVGQAKFYFGYLLAPFFTLVPLYISVFFERLAENNSRIIRKYIYLYVAFVVAMVPVMYNLNILMDSLFFLFISLVLMKISEVKLLTNGKIQY